MVARPPRRDGLTPVPVCLLAAGTTLKLAAAAFTLAWSHTVERQPWQEDWRVGRDHLQLVEMRVKGSGAGMDPPAGSHLEGGWYVWRPERELREELVLRRADRGDGPVGDWLFCPDEGGCSALGELVGADSDPVTITACD